jgi:hypothetical protein
MSRLGLLVAFLALSLGGLSCSGPRPVVVDKSEIVKNEDGTYTVSAAWMDDRMRYEQAMIERIKRCEGLE